MSSESIPENVVVLYFIMCIVAAIIAREINRRFPVFPYTPILILLGILIGAVRGLGQISEGVEQISRIDPHGILMILLPILIFESSYNARLSILKANLFQILLLAVLGVIVTALMLAFCLKFIIGYDDDSMDMNYAIILGFVLGTTDPVAVVALLKELGAPLRTNMLIEMESLLNDGVAMVFFTIFYEIAKGGAATVGQGIVMFLRLAIGGPALGLAFGIGAIILTHFMTKGKTYFMTIILLTSFSVFYTAEKLNVEVSGLLGLVALGFFFSVFLKNQMTQAQEHAVHTILGYIQCIDETFLFFLTGTITGDKLVTDFVTHLEGADVWKMFIFYICLLVVRVIMVAFFALVVRSTGQVIYLKEVALQIWGGLRGGLSLALALVVFQDSELENERAKVLILFHTAALATLTLVFNGSTASFIVKWIKLIANTFEREKYKEIFEKTVKDVGLKAIEEQKANETMSLTFWDGVLNLLKFNKEIDIHIEPTLSLQRYKVLRMFIENLQGHQGEQYLSKSIYNTIVEASEVACEQCAQPIDVYTNTENGLTSIKMIDYFRNWQQTQFVGKFFQFLTLFTLEENFSVIQLLILVLSQTIGQLQERNDEQETLQPIIHELQNNLKKASDIMFIFKSKYPGEIQKISQRQAAIKILVTQTQYVDSYIGSFITQKEGTEIKTFFFKRLEETNSLKMLTELDSGPEYILESSFRGLLKDKELIKICQCYELKQATSGATIISSNQPVDHCFLILEGIMEENINVQGINEIQQIQYSTGNLVGVPNVIDKKVESVIQLLAKTDCQFLQIPITLIREVLEQNKKFEELCYKESLATFLVLYHSEQHKFNQFVHLQLYNWAMKAKLIKVTGTQEKMLEELILPIYGAFVYEGEWLSLDGKYKANQWAYIEPMKMQLKPIKAGIVLLFNTKLHLESSKGQNDRHSERSLSVSHEESMLLEHPGAHH